MLSATLFAPAAPLLLLCHFSCTFALLRCRYVFFLADSFAPDYLFHAYLNGTDTLMLLMRHHYVYAG